MALLVRLDVADLTGENRSFSERNSSPGIEATEILGTFGSSGLTGFTAGRKEDSGDNCSA